MKIRFGFAAFSMVRHISAQQPSAAGLPSLSITTSADEAVFLSLVSSHSLP